MLPLTDPRWATLKTAYGEPSLAPVLARLLTEPLLFAPESERPTLEDEIWTQIYHQRTLYPATIAAVPHIVQAIRRLAPAERMPWLAMVAEIEAMRAWQGEPPELLEDLTPDLLDAYRQAIQETVLLATETLAARTQRLPYTKSSEADVARLLSFLAFAHGEGRLGFLLARWWPYAEAEDGTLLPLAGVKQFEELVRPAPKDDAPRL